MLHIKCLFFFVVILISFLSTNIVFAAPNLAPAPGIKQSIVIQNDGVLIFILYNYGDLTIDIMRQEGQYLDGLLSLAKIEEDKVPEFKKSLKNLLLSEESIHQFAIKAEQTIKVMNTSK